MGAYGDGGVTPSMTGLLSASLFIHREAFRFAGRVKINCINCSSIRRVGFDDSPETGSKALDLLIH